jgi:nicotinamidase-related amidase
MRTLALSTLLAALAATAWAAEVSPVAAAPTPTTALLVIDVQNFYFPGGKQPLTGPEAAAGKARLLIDAFRGRSWPVIHVLHLGKGQATPAPDSGELAYRAHLEAMPRPGEPVIGKRDANAFKETELLSTLRRLGVKRLVVVGMQTQMCVEAATRAAADLGFEVTVVHDACATRPLAFGGLEVPAAQVHAAALATMAGAYAKVVSAEELIASFPPSAPRP